MTQPWFSPAPAEQFYSLNGTPNVSRAVAGGRYCAPIIAGRLPISLQIRVAVAFM